MNKPNSNSEDFYRQLSSDYDRMIRFEKRLENERPVFESLFRKYPVQSVMDTACGTGMHVIMLNQMGIRSIGADISAEMLDLARKNTEQYKCKSTFYHSPMQELSEKIKDSFDALICLGNSLPHILDLNELKKALTSSFKLLNSGGILILGMLNFERVRLKNERVLSVNRQGANEYIRFYDIDDKKIYFNILTLRWKDDQATHHLQTTELRPYSRDQLNDELREIGFKELQYFGSMRLEPYSEEMSKNLVIIAKKP